MNSLHKKQCIIVGLLSLLIIVTFITLYSASCVLNNQYSIPHGCNNVIMRNGVSKINEDGTFQFTVAQYTSICNDANEMKRLSKILHSLDVTAANKFPSDVQLIEFRFENLSDYGFRALESIYLAYDFYEKKHYANIDNIWYYLEYDNTLDEYINEGLLAMLAFRGQSTYSLEEFSTADFENATFRYNLYWEKQQIYGGDLNVQLTDFNNTDEVPIDSRADAIKRAAEELDYDNPVGVTFHDETCGYYMVELANDNGNGIVKINDGVIELIEPIYTVIMDDKGRTLEVYKGFTRTRPFWP